MLGEGRQVPAEGRLQGAQEALQPLLELARGLLLSVCAQQIQLCFTFGSQSDKKDRGATHAHAA